MTTIEKVAYIKGLMEGMKVDETSDNGKLFKLIVEILDELTKDVADIEDYVAELTEQVDAVDEDLNSLEEDFYEEWDDEDECYSCLVNLDEDEYLAFVSNPNYRCPYFRLDDEYSIVRKQN